MNCSLLIIVIEFESGSVRRNQMIKSGISDLPTAPEGVHVLVSSLAHLHCAIVHVPRRDAGGCVCGASPSWCTQGL